MSDDALLSMDQVEAKLSAPGLGFERITTIPGSTYRDNSTVVIVTTKGSLDFRASAAINAMISPMNQKRTTLWSKGDDMATAFDGLLQFVVAHPDLGKWKYVLTVADDVLPPADAQIRMLESIEWGPYDAVSAALHTKGEVSLPMLYGDHAEYASNGVVSFDRRRTSQALSGGNVAAVNGFGMECALWRMSFFKDLPKPWFMRAEEQFEPGWSEIARNRLRLCDTAIKTGRRLAVDLRVHAGRIDSKTGTVY